jgi:DNA-binding transcriptional MerR regulator
VTAAGAASARAGMSIGEVLAHLRVEFPDATISKLRFLEAEGLVEPQRTPAGYRKYTWDDVARLRFVLTAQRDHYLPLRVIREQLAGGAAEIPGAGRPLLLAVGAATAGAAGPGMPARLGRTQLLAEAGIDESLLTAIEEVGLVAADVDGEYDTVALDIAAIVGRLRENGLEPRHLRPFRLSAEREVAVLVQLVAPLARASGPAARARAAQAAGEIAALAQELHATLVRVGLRDALSP